MSVGNGGRRSVRLSNRNKTNNSQDNPDAEQMKKNKLIDDFKRMKIGVMERIDLLGLNEDDAQSMTIAQLGVWAREHCPNAVQMMDKKRLKKDVIAELLKGCAARIKVEHSALARVRQRALDAGILPLELDEIDLYDGAPVGEADGEPSDLDMHGRAAQGDESKEEKKDSNYDSINGEPFEVVVDRVLRERFGDLKAKASSYDALVTEFEKLKKTTARDRATIKQLKDKLDEKDVNEFKGDGNGGNENSNSNDNGGKVGTNVIGNRSQMRRRLGDILGRQPQALHVSYSSVL